MGSAEDASTCSTVSVASRERRVGRSHSFTPLTLDPEDGLPRGIVGGAESDGLQPAHAEVVVDPREFSVDRVHCVGQVRAERVGVEESADPGGRPGPARYELSGPAQHMPAERPDIGAEDVVHVQIGPHVEEFLGGLLEGAVMGREVGGVDRARADAGNDGDLQPREPPRQVAQDPGLVGGPRSPATHDEREIAVAAV